MDELHGLIDVETDRLTRLVTSLLDMTRIDAGVLEVRRGPTSVAALVDEAVTALVLDARRTPRRGLDPRRPARRRHRPPPDRAGTR